MTARPGTVGEVLAEAAARLAAAGDETARLDAEVLLAHVLGGTRSTLIVRRDVALEADEAARFAELVARRAAGQPVAYLTGEREFHSLALAVDPRVLIPRPETETVVETALSALRALAAEGFGRRLRVVDVGTGSGAIAVALAHELAREGAGARVSLAALDRSLACLAVARVNAERHAPGAVSLVCGDLTAAFRDASLDLVVSNPPYLSQDELERVSPEVRAEPVAALLGGDMDGAGTLRALLADAARVLRPGGFLVSEIGFMQGESVAALARDLGFGHVEIRRDLAGRDRVVSARWRPAAGAER
ncbi:MAG: peptide chain release factor N(5)-glutamine methyltransferase [Thermodesulfobacteriota bacterium]